MALRRLDRVRSAIAERQLDALLVTHPPNLRYLTGLHTSAGLLLVTADDCICIVDPRYATAAESLAAHSGRWSVRVFGSALDERAARLAVESGAVTVGVEADHLALSRFRTLVKVFDESADGTRRRPELFDTSGVVEASREIKDVAEISTMREAARRLSAVASRARELAQPGQTERQVAAAVDAAVRAAGFERAAFETIVASGPNAALPHARPTNRVLRPGDGVVLDFGGVYDGYCVDLTRTLHIGPAPDDFRRLFAAVREAHAAAIAAVAPGALTTAIDAAARGVLEGHGLGEAFSHGTGHGLGLEVHEAPRISKAAEPRPVQPGMVFTIEPGAYVPGLGGVRIEDDVLVLDDGCEILTDVPIEL